MELAQILAELPEDCLYAAEQDLWLRPEGDEVVVGAVRFVVAHGDFMLFYPRPCEIPVMRERSLGVMETAKTAVAITCPISCTIVETNQAAQQNIDVVTQDPYGAGWLYRLKPMAWQDESMFLMGVKEYRAQALDCEVEIHLTSSAVRWAFEGVAAAAVSDQRGEQTILSYLQRCHAMGIKIYMCGMALAEHHQGEPIIGEITGQTGATSVMAQLQRDDTRVLVF